MCSMVVEESLRVSLPVSIILLGLVKLPCDTHFTNALA